MDQNLERQIIRVLGAFQKAAEKRCGPEERKAPEPKKKRLAPMVRPDNWRDECPTRQRIRKMLQENPSATNQEIIDAVATSKHVIAEVRKEFGFRCPRSRGYENRKRIEEVLEANPEATGAEIARIVGVGERYAQDVIKRMKWEKSRRS